MSFSRRVADGLPVGEIEKAIEEEFGSPVTVILRTEKGMAGGRQSQSFSS